MKHWVVQHQPGESRRARDHLEAQGMAPWAPQHDGCSLIPGYLVIRSSGVPWAANSTPGCIRLLPSSDRPLSVPDDQVEVMREVERAMAEMDRTKPKPEQRDYTIAGIGRTMLANLLQQAGITVKLRVDRVEPAVALPGQARRNHGHDVRRAIRASVR